MEKVPAPQPKKEDSGEKIDHSRRKFTRGMLFAAIAAAGGVSSSDAEAQEIKKASLNPEVTPAADDFDRLLDSSGHMKYWKQQLRTYQATVRSSEGQKILSDPAEMERSTRMLLRDYPPCFFDMLNKDSKTEIRRYFAERSVMIINDGKNSRVLAPARVIDKAKFIKSSASWSYGNGIVLRRENEYFIATNAHVIEATDTREEVSARAKGLTPPDVAFYMVSAESLRKIGIDPRHAIDIAKPVPAQKSSLGTPIFSIPFDPDAANSADPRIPSGYKEWFGLRLTISPGLSNDLGGRFKKWINEPILVTSIGEGDSQKKTVSGRSWSYSFAQGTSGGAVASYINGEPHFEGLLAAGSHIYFPKTSGSNPDAYQKDFSLAKYENREAVYAALNDKSRIFTLPTITV